MKPSLGPKGNRCLTFLVGMRNPRVAAAMAPHGFGEATLKEGWRLLGRLSTLRFAQVDPTADPQVIATLDQFENKWFPICKASLEHHYPEIAVPLFHNLGQTSGPGVALTVGTFIDRIHEMERGEGPYAGSGPAARELLAERGLDEATVTETEVVIAQLQSVQNETTAHPTPEQVQAAEDALWAWYLEWSTIARVTLTERRLLRSLGFLRTRRNGGDEVVDDTDLADETNDATEPTEPVTPPDEAGAADQPAAAPPPAVGDPEVPASATTSPNDREAGQPAE